MMTLSSMRWTVEARDRRTDTIARAAHYGEKAKDALGLFADSETRRLLA